MATKPGNTFGKDTPVSASGKITRYNGEKQRSDLLTASKHTEKLLGVLQEGEFPMFERRSLESLRLMLSAFHEGMKAYEEK